MSIILKGVDLPKEGEVKVIDMYGDGSIFVDNGTEYKMCPQGSAIQIPEGHGRLIDEKEVKKMSHDVILGNGAKHRCIDATRMYEAPTILESEEE